MMLTLFLSLQVPKLHQLQFQITHGKDWNVFNYKLKTLAGMS